MRRYRIDQPESAMHGWVVNGTLSYLERFDVDYIAFTYDGIEYGVRSTKKENRHAAEYHAKRHGSGVVLSSL